MGCRLSISIGTLVKDVEKGRRIAANRSQSTGTSHVLVRKGKDLYVAPEKSVRLGMSDGPVIV